MEVFESQAIIDFEDDRYLSERGRMARSPMTRPTSTVQTTTTASIRPQNLICELTFGLNDNGESVSMIDIE